MCDVLKIQEPIAPKAEIGKMESVTSIKTTDDVPLVAIIDEMDNSNENKKQEIMQGEIMKVEDNEMVVAASVEAGKNGDQTTTIELNKMANVDDDPLVPYIDKVKTVKEDLDNEQKNEIMKDEALNFPVAYPPIADEKKEDNNNLLKKHSMKNLLFIRGNREKLDKANIVESYRKIQGVGFITGMPIEYISMEEAKKKLNAGQSLVKPVLKRDKGEGEATISNFRIELEDVVLNEYGNYDGVCIDGQHRTLALYFLEGNIEVTYREVSIPDNMDILQYISLRNNGKNWKNDDFFNSNISTHNPHVDYILKQREKGFAAVFLANVYSFGTVAISPSQIKAMQQGYKRMENFKTVQLDAKTQAMGDMICQACEEHPFLSKDKLIGRFGAGLKTLYKSADSNMEKVVAVLEKIDKHIWEMYFTAKQGQSMEVKAYESAFESVLALLK